MKKIFLIILRKYQKIKTLCYRVQASNLDVTRDRILMRMRIINFCLTAKKIMRSKMTTHTSKNTSNIKTLQNSLMMQLLAQRIEEPSNTTKTAITMKILTLTSRAGIFT